MGYKKMTENEMTGIGVSSAGNILTGSAEQNKRVFDNLPIAIGKNVNEVIDALEGVDAKRLSHTADASNPHSVTKAQVGLGNVDNTADLDKPVSVATSAALAEKADKTELAKKVDRAELAVALTEKADVSALEKKADASTENGGFAGGKDAVAGAGVAAGEGAKTVNENGRLIDAIQLGTGVNKNPKTMQVYEHPVFDANTGKLVEGVIPDSVAKADELEAFEKEVAEGFLLKADKAELELKADSDTMTEALAKKVDKSELDEFITQAELDEALSGSVDGEVNLTNYYTKTEVDGKVSVKADKATSLSGYGIADAYTKSEVNAKVSGKADKATTLSGYGVTNAYTKTEVDNKVSAKADKATTLSGYGIGNAYTKTEVDTKVNLKANAADVTAGLAEKADKTVVESLSDAVSALGDVANEDVVPVSKGGTGAVDAASALAALGGVRISAKQTYVGGGFCDNYLHLAFEFSPKLMFICGGGCSAVFVRDADKALVCGTASNSDGSAHYCDLTWGGDNSVWWISDTVMSQFNLSGEIYTAYAIG